MWLVYIFLYLASIVDSAWTVSMKVDLEADILYPHDPDTQSH